MSGFQNSIKCCLYSEVLEMDSKMTHSTLNAIPRGGPSPSLKAGLERYLVDLQVCLGKQVVNGKETQVHSYFHLINRPS